MNASAQNSTPHAISPALPVILAKTPRDDKRNSIVTRSGTNIEPARRRSMIAEAAYYHSERRGFGPGHELDDWLAAETRSDAVALGATSALAGG